MCADDANRIGLRLRSDESKTETSPVGRAKQRPLDGDRLPQPLSENGEAGDVQLAKTVEHLLLHVRG
jgi:hypothetical protein